MCYHTLGTGMSEAPVLVPIFPYTAVGGARPRSYFRQGNWESETNCLKIFDEKIAPQAKFLKQNFWNKISETNELWHICAPLQRACRRRVRWYRKHICIRIHLHMQWCPEHLSTCACNTNCQKKARIQTHICTRIHKRMNTHVQSWHHPNTPQNSYWDSKFMHKHAYAYRYMLYMHVYKPDRNTFHPRCEKLHSGRPRTCQI